MRRVLVCLALTLFGLSAAEGTASPILVNGSFEDGPAMGTGTHDLGVDAGSNAIPGWEVFATGGTAIDYLGPPWDVSDGIHAIDLDGRDSVFGGVRQTFATTAGRRYDVVFDLSGNPGIGPGTGLPLVKNVRVSVGTFSQDYAHDSSGQAEANLVWDSIGFSFVANSPTSTLSFMSLTGTPSSYGALLDNVRVTVPEPTALLLLGAGLAAAKVRKRQRPALGRPSPL